MPPKTYVDHELSESMMFSPRCAKSTSTAASSSEEVGKAALFVVWVASVVLDIGYIVSNVFFALHALRHPHS